MAWKQAGGGEPVARRERTTRLRIRYEGIPKVQLTFAMVNIEGLASSKQKVEGGSCRGMGDLSGHVLVTGSGVLNRGSVVNATLAAGSLCFLHAGFEGLNDGLALAPVAAVVAHAVQHSVVLVLAASRIETLLRLILFFFLFLRLYVYYLAVLLLHGCSTTSINAIMRRRHDARGRAIIIVHSFSRLGTSAPALLNPNTDVGVRVYPTSTVATAAAATRIAYRLRPAAQNSEMTTRPSA
ncbi:uncharacterized protein MONBRDRAFT_11612 [Monosiga brevicollis MX1]|uniref:Uncharacterized protein n=1 Tax=Monosiga brevicollis TaxID=81824 RepID=A9V9S7_MONBE|nr:uncharacterized protein MONBRDRAFT_11612 [Monosiga brevicollis MX1]EDQ85775.1 predicted protein [Monosiga brevicollis MX1]|eukprot:XP_001749490.1 hypothetical protein [Monosiga brevicollis MX1]